MGVTIGKLPGPLQYSFCIRPKADDNSINVTIVEIPAAQGPSFNTKSVSTNTNTNSQY